MVQNRERQPHNQLRLFVFVELKESAPLFSMRWRGESKGQRIDTHRGPLTRPLQPAVSEDFLAFSLLAQRGASTRRRARPQFYHDPNFDRQFRQLNRLFLGTAAAARRRTGLLPLSSKPQTKPQPDQNGQSEYRHVPSIAGGYYHRPRSIMHVYDTRGQRLALGPRLLPFPHLLSVLFFEVPACSSLKV
jgi:hypothetical protein